MQRSDLWTVALLSTVAVLSIGCSDLGTCDEDTEGRTTVTYGTQFMYTGQAIITSACATGCHNSGVSAKSRHGAPGDLNFDLYPLPAGAPIYSGGASGTPVAVQVDSKQLEGLRARQRKVYEMRESIWDQVEKGLMPPKGIGAYESLIAIKRAVFGTDTKKCTATAALTTLSAHKEELRTWLACGTPVVETTSEQLPYKELEADASVADKAAGTGYYATAQRVGYQYPACMPSGGGGDGGVSAPSFHDLYGTVFATCASCHLPKGLNDAVDFSSEDAAYTSLLGANGMGRPQVATCSTNTAPYVTPGDPSKSYLLAKMDKTGMSGVHCLDLMPQPGGSDASSVSMVRAWIAAGALRMPAAGGVGDAGM